MKAISLFVPEGDLDELDLLVLRGYGANRSELIRVGIKFLLKQYFDKGIIPTRIINLKRGEKP